MQTATAVVAPDGTFLARWRTDAIGSFTVRAIIAGAQAQTADASAPTTSVTIYRPARATWFGPGFYGKHTACGQVMSHALLGVAHRTLPCGTPVALFYGGKAITVPVIDRGPFANGARYDLTSAAAQAVGMTQTSTVGVVPQRGAQMAPPTPAPSPYAGTGGVAPTP
jgi:rare lipoprotein A (peptidoglycan hydrolase)